MKCEIIIDSFCEEKVVVYAKEKNALVEEIKKLVEQSSTALLGYKDSEITNLNLIDIHCISVISNKVYALCDKERYLLKERLYSLQEKLPDTFVKINQSCLANIKNIERFDTSISGTLKIRFKNGHIDYVSRRQLKLIKERIGI
ncbi:MAG: LytTR family transcriptional regulator [Clostridia bacterium]|nr:LytTR family transcriptional regulator [Clostridia bacterium]